jgi:hypothetical protein
VEDLHEIFTILYQWKFGPEKTELIDALEAKLKDFVPSWKTVMGKGKSRNYYHYLEVEAVKV